MPVAQEQLRGEFFPHAILWKERMWVHLLRQIEKGQIFLVDVLFWQGRRKSWTTVFNNENKNVPEDKKTNIKIIDNIYKYVEENPDLQVLKITVCDESKIIFDSIIRKLREVKNVDVLDLQHMARKYIKLGTEEKKVEYYYTEITSKDVDKWGAIEKLADRLQIDKEEIMAIGDNMNDKRMVENAGLGVMMENCAPYMKEFADVIVKDNNNDGVAEAIEKYVLSEE